MSFSCNLLISFVLSGFFQVAALSQAQAKLSPGDSWVEKMNRGEVRGEMIQSLEAKVVSKVILNDEQGQPLCVVDIGENPDLSPHFATPAPPDFNSSLSVDLRPCDLSEMGFINDVAQNSVLGPTKVAGAPLVLGGWILLSCAAGGVGGAIVSGGISLALAFGGPVAVGGAGIALGGAGVAVVGGVATAAHAGRSLAVRVPVAGAAIACFSGVVTFLLED